ncbi:MAG: AMP-binding protein [Bacteroidales bacterium]|nr:AMP-binding protein [Bacteroidales bacterium]
MLKCQYIPLYSNLVEMLDDKALKYAEKIAIIELNHQGHEIGSITYHDLMQRSQSLAAVLLENDQKRDACLVMLSPGIDYVAAILGCIYAGIPAIPSFPPRPNKKNERFRSIVSSAKPSSVILDKDSQIRLEKSALNSGIQLAAAEIHIENIPSSAHPPYKAPHIRPQDVALLQYTSGTTGTPLGTMITHEGILHNSELIKTAFGHDDKLTVVGWLPPFHDMGLIGTLLQPLYTGGSNVIIQSNDFLKNPVIWLDSITKYRATTVGCPNFALDLLAERITPEQKKNIDLSSLKVFFCGSEPIHPGSVKGFVHAFAQCGFQEKMFLPCYGLAENTLMATGIHFSESPEYLFIDRKPLEKMGVISISDHRENGLGLVGCGKAWLDEEIKIVDTETRITLPEGQVGEVLIKSRSACLGYYNNPLQSNELFSSGEKMNGSKPFMKTGDLGFIFNEQLFITGRIKEMMKIRGKNHYPYDIERTVEDCHHALQANACAAFHITKGQQEELVILQEIKRTAIRDLDGDEVVEAIRMAVSSEHEITAYAVALVSPGRIPRTSSGKIQRIKSRAMWLDHSLKTIFSSELANGNNSSQKPEDIVADPDIEHLQEWLIQWLSNKVGIDPKTINRDTPILAYGLDSMGAVELEREVNEKFGIEIHLADFLENNTIEALARIGMESLVNNKT